MTRSSLFVTAALIVVSGLCLATSPAQAEPKGMYTDKAVYEPGDTISVHASLPETMTVPFELRHHGAEDETVLETPPATVDSQPTEIGSFLEVPGLDLSDRDAFTIEGWWYPKVVGGDQVMIAGQGDFQRGAGLFVTDDGHLGAYVDTESSQGKVEVVDNDLLLIDEWHHIALRYDDPELSLYLDGEQVGTAEAGGAVTSVDFPFRIGAGPDAPGDLTGIIDGRVDAWSLWPRGLDDQKLDERRELALSEPNPTPTRSSVDFFLGFDATTGQPVDQSMNRNPIQTINYGTPHMVGVHEEGMSIRLNHDQLVDTGWDQTVTIDIPDDAKSGLYSVVVPDPDFPERSFPQVIVRPSTPNADTELAVVAPVNTWLAYNPWPGHHFEIPPAHELYFSQRSRSPGEEKNVSGNNSAYRVMGDGISPAYFQGWRRPSPRASIYNIGEHEFNLAAKLTLDTVQWLEEQDIAYDLYTDWDVDAGRISASDYNLMFFHGHSEYWTRSAIDHINEFADQGGSFLFMSANVMYWHVAQSEDHSVQETRKWPRFVLPTSQGPNDRVTSIGNEKAGLWEYIGVCDESLGSPTMLHGAIFHLLTGGHPSTFGRWEVTQSDHWLWPDDLNTGDFVGKSGFDAETYTVGHETDTFDPQRPPPGLAAGTEVSVLAEGTHFPRLEVADPARDLSFHPDCNYVNTIVEDRWAYESDRYEFVEDGLQSGSIMHYRHQGGGNVLTIASTASVWALDSDEAISTMARRAIDCFGYGQGCPDDSYQPSTPPASNGSANDVRDPDENGSSSTFGCGSSHSGVVPSSGVALLLLVLATLAGLRRYG